jgi:hypothetical protein
LLSTKRVPLGKAAEAEAARVAEEAEGAVASGAAVAAGPAAVVVDGRVVVAVVAAVAAGTVAIAAIGVVEAGGAGSGLHFSYRIFRRGGLLKQALFCFNLVQAFFLQQISEHIQAVPRM